MNLFEFLFAFGCFWLAGAHRENKNRQIQFSTWPVRLKKKLEMPSSVQFRPSNVSSLPSSANFQGSPDNANCWWSSSSWFLRSQSNHDGFSRRPNQRRLPPSDDDKRRKLIIVICFCKRAANSEPAEKRKLNQEVEKFVLCLCCFGWTETETETKTQTSTSAARKQTKLTQFWATRRPANKANKTNIDIGGQDDDHGQQMCFQLS